VKHDLNNGKNGKAEECIDFHLRFSTVDTLDSQQNLIPEQERPILYPRPEYFVGRIETRLKK
jgi:hypothetical protein